MYSAADPGFPKGHQPERGDANLLSGQNFHEHDENWTGGARPKFYYVDPPLVLENSCYIYIAHFMFIISIFSYHFSV